MSLSSGKALEFAHRYREWISAYETLLERDESEDFEALFGTGVPGQELRKKFEQAYDAAHKDAVECLEPLVEQVRKLDIAGVSIFKVKDRLIETEWGLEAFVRPKRSPDKTPRCTFGVHLWPHDDIGLHPIMWIWWARDDADADRVLKTVKAKLAKAELADRYKIDGLSQGLDWERSVVTHDATGLSPDGRVSLKGVRTTIKGWFDELATSGVIADVVKLVYGRA